MKHVLITGAQGDIAVAITKELIKSGKFYLTLPAKDILDVSDIETVEWFFHSAPKIDILINCAGYIAPQTIKNSDPYEWAKEISVNLLGPFLCAREALQKGCELVINIGSTASEEGRAEWSGYCASKRGLVSLTESLNAEGHLAFCLNIGRTKTKMREALFGKEDEDTLLLPEDVAIMVRRIIENPSDYKERNLEFVV